jgi:hypothetical protein
MHQLDSSPKHLGRRVRRSSSSLDQADLVARAKKNVPIQIEYPHPLTWWRTRPAHSFKDADVLIARRFLKKSAIIGEPHWFLGAEGDAAVALGVAMRIRRQQRSNLVSLDLAMTAVLCVALEGNAAAALLLSATLKRSSGTDRLHHVLSDSWLRNNLQRRRFG